MDELTHRELLLLGDSLLAEVGWRRTDTLDAAIAPEWRTYNCATSGFTAEQALQQAPVHARMRPAGVLVSLGTNDASTERSVSVDAFAASLGAMLAMFEDARRVVLVPPGLHDPAVEPYRAAVQRIADAAGAAAIDGRTVAERVSADGAAPFVDDGVHFTDAMYVALAGELAELLR